MNDKVSTKSILVAEDDAEFRELLTTKLEMTLGADLQIIHAVNGMEASGRLPYQAFDCIVTDLKMPVKEGQALVKTVTQSTLNAATPIVVVTGEPDNSLEKKYKQLKQFEKPCDLDEVIGHIEQQLKLGPTDKRIAAALLNNFVAGVDEFFNKTLNILFQGLPPFPKPSGTPITGDVFQIYNIRSGTARARFVVGYDKGVINKIGAQVGQETPNYEKLTSAAGKVIYERLTRKSKINAEVELTEGGFFTHENDKQTKFFGGIKGIVIPLGSECGNIHIHVFW